MTLWKQEKQVMSKGLIGWSVLVALTTALVVTPAATASAQNRNTNRLVVPITGTAAGVGAVAGNVAISRFEIQDGRLMAIGALTATVTDATGNVIRTIVTQVAMPVNNAAGGAAAAAAGSCDILNLVLGPLHLELLGLVVDLNQVVLNITGQTGAGNLLGNLLCAITGLLDAGSLGTQLVNLLNQLIGVLGAL
jgi:hypothetical protein